MTEVRNVFTLLDAVRERPTMFLRNGLRDLEVLLYGYCSALANHRIDEGVPDMSHFLDFMGLRTRWPLSLGWAEAINKRASGTKTPLDVFFEFVDEYRALRPIVVARVALKAHHQPTGRRVVYGMSGRLERPDIVEVVQYRPEPLFYLRMHYGRCFINRGILFDNGSLATSLRFAKRWMAEELSVTAGEWEPLGKGVAKRSGQRPRAGRLAMRPARPTTRR